ncbi:hypothetical protein M0L22_RS00410 [Providencia rettgeri]|nr:hypothetical protein [Providencia rettgeri]ELL9147941.1 hypothetical protein [Providencia rettgeri]ELR5283212.1 hypothetical protein [Providencia rettgeri]
MKLKTVKIRMGSDTYQKAEILYKSLNFTLNEGERLPIEGESIEATINYCIEVAYNDLKNKAKRKIYHQEFPLPTSRKALKLYYIYQIVRTLKYEGKNRNEIISYMNKRNHPTPDDILALKYADLINNKKKYSIWKTIDYEYLMEYDERINLIKLLNKLY